MCSEVTEKTTTTRDTAWKTTEPVHHARSPFLRIIVFT